MVTFSNISDYVTDENVEMAGVDLSFGKGRFITIRRAGGANEDFNIYSAQRLAAHKDAVKHKELTDDEARDAMFDIYAKKIVIGWRGWKDDNSNDIPFTTANCIALFNSSIEIYKTVFDESQDLNNFRKEEVSSLGNE